MAVALVTVLGQFAENSTTEFWRRLLYIGIPAAGLIYTGVWLEEKGRMRFSRPFRFIGDISYSLYLSHVFTLVVFARIIVLFLPNLDAALLMPVFLILAPVLTIAVGYASYRLVELPLVHLCRISIPSVFRVGEQINT